jgi:hypothetical protein
MSWTERDGPPVSAPKRRGFGTIVMEAMAERSVDRWLLGEVKENPTTSAPPVQRAQREPTEYHGYIPNPRPPHATRDHRKIFANVRNRTDIQAPFGDAANYAKHHGDSPERKNDEMLDHFLFVAWPCRLLQHWSLCEPQGGGSRSRFQRLRRGAEHQIRPIVPSAYTDSTKIVPVRRKGAGPASTLHLHYYRLVVGAATKWWQKTTPAAFRPTQ